MKHWKKKSWTFSKASKVRKKRMENTTKAATKRHKKTKPLTFHANKNDNNTKRIRIDGGFFSTHIRCHFSYNGCVILFCVLIYRAKGFFFRRCYVRIWVFFIEIITVKNQKKERINTKKNSEKWRKNTHNWFLF